MLITLTCHAPNAPDVGYLFGKNPASLFAREFSGGRVLVFYPEVAEDHLTIALLTEIDPIALVRTASGAHGLDQYVNDRPYVASSLTSVALNVAFGSALGGKSRERPERVNEVLRWEVSLPVVACDAGEDFITRIFAPLGYEVDGGAPAARSSVSGVGTIESLHNTLVWRTDRPGCPQPPLCPAAGAG